MSSGSLSGKPLNIPIVVFPTFHFRDEVNIRLRKQKRKGKIVYPTQLQEWLDGLPRTAMSGDGKDLIYHLPNTFRRRSEVSCISFVSGILPV